MGLPQEWGSGTSSACSDEDLPKYTYRIDLSLLHLNNEPKIKQAVSERSTVLVSPAYLTYPSNNQEHYPDMATVLLARLNGKFVEVKRKITRKEVHRTKQSFNYIGSSFNNRENARSPI